MPLTVISGLPGSDSRARLFEFLAPAARSGGRALLVVPTSAHAVRMRPELASAAPVGLQIIAFNRLVEVEWLLQGDGRHIVTPLHRELLLSRALVDGGVATRPGRGAIALLGTLVSRSCVQGRPAATGRDAGVAGRLQGALTSYLGSLEALGLVEPAEAARILSACPPPAAVIAFDSFTAMTPEQVGVAIGWSQAGADVAVTLPWRSGSAATQPLDALVSELRAAGGVVAEASGQESERPQELQRIVDDLFSASPPTAAQGRVLLGVARGDESEARMIARRVQGVLSDGLAADRVVVAFSDPARHTGWLGRAFDDLDIDAVWDARVPVSETSLGRSMLRLWALSSGGMRREDFSAFLRSPFSGVDGDRADHADVSWRAHRVQGSDLMRLAGGAGRLVSVCAGLVEQPVTPENASKWKSVVDTMMANAYGRDASTPGMDGALDAAVHRGFCQVLAAATAAGELQVTAREAWTAFSASSVSPSSGPASGGVLVTSIRNLALRDFDEVIIGGLTAAETPRQGSDDRLEGEAVRRVMRSLGLTHDSEEQVREERLAFYLATAAAQTHLMLVRSECDDEGRSLRPSVFWDEFLDLYRVPGTDALDDNGLPPTSLEGPDSGLSVSGTHRAPRGFLRDRGSLGLLAEIDAVSPGEVERYVACPYRWFVERRLRPQTLDATVDLLTTGRVAHSALAEFYRTWPQVSGHARVTPERIEEATQRMGIVARAAIGDAPAPVTLEEEWLLATVEPFVVGLVARDARFLPDYHPVELEWSFGLEEGDEPIDLGGVRIKGRADRIDLGPQGLIVIDYKRSRASSLAQIRDSGLVQLQLYAVAASRRLGRPVAGGLYRSLSGPDDRGFVSSEVVGDFKSADVVDAEEMDTLLEGAVQSARDALAGMRAGHIQPLPSSDHCRNCPAVSFCPEGMRS